MSGEALYVQTWPETSKCTLSSVLFAAGLAYPVGMPICGAILCLTLCGHKTAAELQEAPVALAMVPQLAPEPFLKSAAPSPFQ